MTRKLRAYDALAMHLAPNDPAEGERQIDRAILAQQRARYRPRNFHRAIFWIALLLMAFGMTVLGATFLCWLEPSLNRTFYAALAGAVPLLAAKLVFIAGFLCFIYYCTHESGREEWRTPVLPEPIRAWLAEHGRSGLTHWPEIYWSDAKRRANRKDVLGFVVWRNSPCPTDRYPRIPSSPDRPAPRSSHCHYLDSPQGRAASEAYLRAFESRMDDWSRFALKGAVVLMVMLLVSIILPVFPPTHAGRLIRTGMMILFIVGSIMLALGLGAVPMRWLPYRVRRYWFRDLPPEAVQFRDHMIALYR